MIPEGQINEKRGCGDILDCGGRGGESRHGVGGWHGNGARFLGVDSGHGLEVPVKLLRGPRGKDLGPPPQHPKPSGAPDGDDWKLSKTYNSRKILAGKKTGKTK